MNVIPVLPKAAPSVETKAAAPNPTNSSGDFRNVLQRVNPPEQQKDVKRAQAARERDAAPLVTVSAVPLYPASVRPEPVKENPGKEKDKPAEKITAAPKEFIERSIEVKAKGSIAKNAKKTRATAQKVEPRSGARTTSKQAPRPSAPDSIAAKEIVRANGKDDPAAQIIPRHVEDQPAAKKPNQSATAKTIANSTASKDKPATVAVVAQKPTADSNTKRGADAKAVSLSESSRPQASPKQDTASVQASSQTTAKDPQKDQAQMSFSHDKSNASSERVPEKASPNKPAEPSKPEAAVSQPTTPSAQTAETKLAAATASMVRISPEKIRELQAMVTRAVQGLMATADGSKETVFRWNEPQLGVLAFRVSTNGDDVRVDIRADRRDVVTALEQQHTAIEQALASSGLRLQTFDVHHEAQTANLMTHQPNHEQQHRQPAETSSENVAQAPADEAPSFEEKAAEKRTPIWAEHEWVA